MAYGKVVALDGVSLNVERGELVTLVGANGAGKSTLMKAIMGLVHARGGEIEFDGASLARHARPTTSRGLGIAYVPEGRGTLARTERARKSAARCILRAAGTRRSRRISIEC